MHNSHWHRATQMCLASSLPVLSRQRKLQFPNQNSYPANRQTQIGQVTLDR